MRRKILTSLLDWVTWFSVHLGNSFFVLKPTTLFTKCPWFYIYFIIYSIIPVNSSLNAKTAEAAPNSRVTRPPKTSFGPRFQIRPFSDSLMFGFFHVNILQKVVSLKETDTGLIVSLITEGNPAFSLYVFLKSEMCFSLCLSSSVNDYQLYLADLIL